MKVLKMKGFHMKGQKRNSKNNVAVYVYIVNTEIKGPYANKCNFDVAKNPVFADLYWFIDLYRLKLSPCYSDVDVYSGVCRYTVTSLCH